MPSPKFNKLLGALRFKSKGLRMPLDWDLTTPQSINTLYVKSLPNEDKISQGPKVIPPLYLPHLQVQTHQRMCDTLGQFYKDLIDIMCDAVAFGVDQWRLQAKFGPMQIAGPVVVGAPGCLQGPTIESFIKQFPKCVSMTPAQMSYRDAVAEGASKAFDHWAKAATVPGLPLFPSYVMQPPGAAIPSPNIPQKLIACVSPGVTGLLMPPLLKERMTLPFKRIKKISKLHDSDDAYFESMATVLSLGFLTWLANQQVMQVIGSGAVASPTGGPVAGVTMPTPGHFVA